MATSLATTTNATTATTAEKVPLTSFLYLANKFVTLSSPVSLNVLQKVVSHAVNAEQSGISTTGEDARSVIQEHSEFVATFCSTVKPLNFDQRSKLAKIASELVGNLKKGWTPYVVAGISNSIYAHDSPSPDSFTFSDKETQKITETRDFLSNQTDATFDEQFPIYTRGQILGGKHEWVKYHLFVFGLSLEKTKQEKNHIDVHF